MLRKISLDECKRSFLLVRHGQSIWNHDSKFTGWTNIPLTKNGKKEAKTIANIIKNNNLIPNMIFTSVLDRSIETSDIIKNEILNNEKSRNMNIHTSWRLNEKHYGTLEGVPRQFIRNNFGVKYTKKLRNDYYMYPPVLKEKKQSEYKTYKNCYYESIKLGESKQQVFSRTIPYYENEILNSIKMGNFPLIVTHKHTARVLFKYLKDINDEEFEKFKLPEKKIFHITLDKDYKFKDVLHLDF